MPELTVRILCQDPAIDLTIPMGDGSAVITGGLGGWQAVQRQDDVSATDWEGQEPLTQDVPLLLDGYSYEESVQGMLDTIFLLGGRDAAGNKAVPPPVFRVEGQAVFYSGKTWVLGDGGIELDASTTIRRDDGALVRQALTLHLLEWVRPDVIKQRRQKKKKGSPRGHPGKTGGTAFPGSTYVTRKGDTLHKIAARLYGDYRMWKRIGKKNHISDPLRKLPAGKELKL